MYKVTDNASIKIKKIFKQPFDAQYYTIILYNISDAPFKQLKEKKLKAQYRQSIITRPNNIKTFKFTGFNPNLLMSFLAFFSPRLCLALDTISIGSPVTVVPGKPTVPGVPASSNSGIVSSESESVAEPIPTNSTFVGSELAALSSSVNSGMFTDL
ncbi:hypothetical protein ALC57_01051 [Trachymyrmex cornetzi]|uniref:Uncharacterized protein n=1 Tax=Trachymyrmex cornetzi TaxID=471704 RepID=A0A151JR07_9HYME|nr:hypothetical protein ALC57_01051 [Trachymyrmex cornetzi]